MTVDPDAAGVGRGTLLRWAGWFSMANALLWILVALRYLEVGHLSSAPAGLLFGIAMFPAHAASVAILLWLPVFLLALIWPQRHLVTFLGMAIGMASTTLLFADTVIYQQYRFHINTAVLSLYFSDASAEIFQFPWIMKLQIGAIMAAIAAVQAFLAYLVWRFVRRSRHRNYGYALASVLVLLILGTNGYHAYADAAGNIAVTRQTRLLPLYEPLTARSFFKEHGVEIARTPLSQIEAVYGSFDYPRVPLQTHAPSHRPNLLWILIDSWRFDAMTPQVTPNIAAFARDNIQFTNHYSGGNATRVGIYTLFYGIPGTYWHSALATETPAALVQRLDALGYEFALFPSAPLTSPEFNRTVFAGLDDLRLTSQGDSSPARDIDATEGLLQFLEHRDEGQPFFGFIFYDSPHAFDLPDDAPMPFQPSWTSVNFLTLDDDTNPEPFFNLYRNSVHFVDGLVARVLQKVRAEGLMQNTIILVTGDHGQEFNDTGLGYWGHNGNYSRFQTKVPLVIHWPGKPAQQINYFTSHFDVAATLMQRVLGVENAFAATSVGRDLFAAGGRLPIVMAEYRGYAAYTGKRIVVFPPFGGVAVRTLDYQLLEDASPSPTLIREVLQQMRWFRGH